MLVDRHADEQGRQKRENIGLQEGHEQFQQVSAAAAAKLPTVTPTQRTRSPPAVAAMKPTITANTMCPANMLANRRTASTA